MARLQRGAANIYYEIHGSGPAILLTHGFAAESKMWQGQIDALSRHHSLILWDMRGHGRTQAPPRNAAFSEALTTADMAALLDAGAETAVIGGCRSADTCHWRFMRLSRAGRCAFNHRHRTRTRTRTVGLIGTDGPTAWPTRWPKKGYRALKACRRKC